MISEKEAKSFFSRYEDLCRKFDPFVPPHVASVVRTARFMAEVDGLNPDEAAAAAWLHDIGYSLGTKDGHAEASLRICQEAGLSLSAGQADAIAHHGTQGLPTTKLGKLMQIADKLSLLDESIVRASYPEHLKELKDVWLPMVVRVLEKVKS